MKRRRITSIILILVIAVTTVACEDKPKQKETTNVSTQESKKEETLVAEKQEEKGNEEEVKDSEEQTEQVEEIPTSHVHSYTTTVVEVSCTKDGYTLNACECGDERKEDVIQKTGHSFSGWETVKSATVTTKGKAERICGACGKVETKELDKLSKKHEHSYEEKTVESTCKLEGYTVYTCKCGDSYMDNKKAKKDHEYQSKVTTPTCTTEGYTTYTCACGDTYIGNKTNKISHSYTDKVVSPTCKTEGYTKHICSKCGGGYIDSEVPAIGHSYKLTSDTATCAAAGKKTETCQTCGDKKTSNSAAKGHDTRSETRVVTCMHDGYAKEICKTCGTVVSNTIIPAFGDHNWVTQSLPMAAKEYQEYYDDYYFYKYGNLTDHITMICSKCKEIDLSTAKIKYTPYEAANLMLGYVNELRREALGPGYDLVLDPTLLDLAQIRSKEISEYFSHFGGTYTNAAENIIAMAGSLKSMFNGWKESSGHYQNMINKNYKYFGFGVYHRDLNYGTGMYGVQLFWSQNAKDCY